MTTLTHETQPPVTDLEIQMLRVYYNALDNDRKRQLLDYSQQLLDYAQQLVDEQQPGFDAETTG